MAVSTTRKKKSRSAAKKPASKAKAKPKAATRSKPSTRAAKAGTGGKSTAKAAGKSANGKTPAKASSPKARKGKIVEPDRAAPPMAEVDSDVLEFIAAIDRFKLEHGRPFPNWSEVLMIVKQLGYSR